MQFAEYVSHSCSSVVLEFMFTKLLPDLSGKNVLDVGSRLGAVLFGAHLFSNARQVVGIEINSDFCRIAQEAIQRHGMSDRASVIHAEMTTRPDLVGAADVIVLHNAFEWFMSAQDQLRMWTFLRQTAKPGALLVTAPALYVSLGKLGQSVEGWVTELGLLGERVLQEGAKDEEGTELVHLYQVIAR